MSVEKDGAHIISDTDGPLVISCDKFLQLCFELLLGCRFGMRLVVPYGASVFYWGSDMNNIPWFLCFEDIDGYVIGFL